MPSGGLAHPIVPIQDDRTKTYATALLKTMDFVFVSLEPFSDVEREIWIT